MKFRRDVYTPEGGTLTVRYMPAETTCDRTIEVTADKDGVCVTIDMLMANPHQVIYDLYALLTRASAHQYWLSKKGHLARGNEPANIQVEPPADSEVTNVHD